MTDELEPEVKREMEEQFDKTVKRGTLFAAGVESEFWKELLVMLREEREKAFNDFSNTPYSDTAAICELQVIGKMGRFLESKVMAWIEKANELVQ